MSHFKVFNIFEILQKDDKELIHSAFIKFLLEESNSIYDHLLKLNGVKFDIPILEDSRIIKLTIKEARELQIKNDIKNDGEKKLISKRLIQKIFGFCTAFKAYDWAFKK